MRKIILGLGIFLLCGSLCSYAAPPSEPEDTQTSFFQKLSYIPRASFQFLARSMRHISQHPYEWGLFYVTCVGMLHTGASPINFLCPEYKIFRLSEERVDPDYLVMKHLNNPALYAHREPLCKAWARRTNLGQQEETIKQLTQEIATIWAKASHIVNFVNMYATCQNISMEEATACGRNGGRG